MENTGKIIRINSGDVCYSIVNERDEVIGEIRFNPNDMDIYRRAEEVEKWFESMRGHVLNEDEGDGFEQYMKFSDAIKDKFNYMLNRNVDKEIFRVCSPLTITSDGSMYFLQALDAILTVVREEQRKAYSALDKKVNEAVEAITNE